MLAATSNFLIPNATLIVEGIAFLIVLAVVARYILPPINRALVERQQRIGEEMAAAERARADAAAADDERRATLEEARGRAREIVAQANQVAEQVRSDAQARGQEAYERLVASADAEIALARQRAVAEATEHLGEMVIGVVEAIIGREVDEAAHRDLIEEAIEAVSAGTDGSAAAAGSRT
jgi:F-type H+-transporting ATPase subunit b